ncbi:MAG: hypothetical protein CBD44_01070 [Flavobacteriaceae bacterium TMED184]|nr:MAG: hypothetical protein CBD44_01070 [Flavobacteriaceae bacterium TMED184]|tara:strand:- start:6032 stop:6625 length:594 start_codon:yes stop_codon:yes gene_type:complete
MEKSYSLLAANHLDLLKDLNNKSSKFSSVHVDLTDNFFCETLGISILTLEQLAGTELYDIDVHLLVEKPKYVLKRIENLKIQSFTFHCETISSKDFSEISLKIAKKGIALSPETDLNLLSNYLESAESVLFLCITPSLFPNDNHINPVNRVQDFISLFPNYQGELIIDGSLDESQFKDLEALGVHSLVLGKKFFDSI